MGIEIFSYWIFIWFLLYLIGLRKENPFWILVIGYLLTIIEFFYLMIMGANNYNLIKFFIINVIIKFIPILIILAIYKFKFIPIKLLDFYFMIYLIIIYLIIMIYINKNPIISYNQMLNSYINNDKKYQTFFSKIYDYLYLKTKY